MRAKEQRARPGGTGPEVDARVTGYVTIYGNHGGDPRFVLVSDYAASVLSIREAVLAKRRGVTFELPGAMTDRERELAHDAWLRREPAA